jgi:hypothetical protein
LGISESAISAVTFEIAARGGIAISQMFLFLKKATPGKPGR